MTHPLIARLSSELDWPCLTSLDAVQDFITAPGLHVLFVPGDPVRNLESADVAVILPELRLAFQNLFDCAVVSDSIEAAVREAAKAFQTPNLIFFESGRQIGDIPKVREWGDYLTRISLILNTSLAAE